MTKADIISDVMYMSWTPNVMCWEGYFTSVVIFFLKLSILSLILRGKTNKQTSDQFKLGTVKRVPN